MLHITPVFSKVLKWSSLFIIAMMGFEYLIWNIEVNTTKIDVWSRTTTDIKPNLVSVLQLVKNVISVTFIWGCIYFLTKEKKGSVFALSLMLLSTLVNYYLFYYTDFTKNPDIGGFLILIWTIPFLFGYLAFGIIHFKKTKAIAFGIIVIILNSISVHYVLFSLIDDFLGGIDIDNIHKISVYSELNEQTSRQNILQFIYSELIIISTIIIFWFTFTFVKNFDKDKFSFFKIAIPTKFDKTTFSILYWTLRLSIISIVFGLANELYFLRSDTAELYTNGIYVYNFIAQIVGLFILGSLLRNILVQYFVVQNKYPKWLYFWLHIPVINFFAWLVLLSKPSAVTNHSFDKIESEMNIENLKEDFTKSNKNNGIKVLIIVFLALSLVDQIGKLTSGQSVDDFMIILLSLIISLILMVLYFENKKAIMGIFIYHIIIYTITAFIFPNHSLNLSFLIGMVNLLIYYPLFHFDNFTFYKSENKELLSKK